MLLLVNPQAQPRTINNIISTKQSFIDQHHYSKFNKQVFGSTKNSNKISGANHNRKPQRIFSSVRKNKI